MSGSRRKRSAHEFAIRRSEFGNAGRDQQCAPGKRFDLAPKHSGAAEQRHVCGIFEMRQPENARRPVRGAAVVAKLELLDADGARAAARQLAQRGAPRGA